MSLPNELVKRQIDPEFLDLDKDLATPVVPPSEPEAMALFSQARALQLALVPATIKATLPQDWVRMGDKLYLQGTGTERIIGLWGISLAEPKITKIDNGDGTFDVQVVGKAFCQRMSILINEVGGASSTDQFFDRFNAPKPSREQLESMDQEERKAWEDTHRIPPKYLDVMKKAYTNWSNRVASKIAGLRGLTVDDLLRAVPNYPVEQIAGFDFSKGSRGGTSQGAAASKFTITKTPGFGAWGNRDLKDVPDKGLEFYLRKSIETLDDKMKSTYHKIERERVAAYEAEIERRRKERETVKTETEDKP